MKYLLESNNGLIKLSVNEREEKSASIALQLLNEQYNDRGTVRKFKLFSFANFSLTSNYVGVLNYGRAGTLPEN